ncbi:MAG: hypothetical protein ABI947_09075 [Chloroflexota bacterium]
MTTSPATLEQVLVQAQLLSPLDKVRLVERLSSSIEREMEVLATAETEAIRIREWQATIERTARALANDPIECPAQGDYEQRDSIL